MQLPTGYVARPYRWRADHGEMSRVLAAYREHHGDPEFPTVEQLDAAYAHLNGCDPDADIFVIEFNDGVVGYGRTSRSSRTHDEDVRAEEADLLAWLAPGASERYRASTSHPRSREREREA